MKRILIAVLVSSYVVACQTPQDQLSFDPLSYVDPFIGTGGHGHTFPGATTPFGMVQLSPDTRLLGWDASSGYHYSDSTVYGFSHTHLSGTGIGDLGDILFLPYTGERNDTLLATFKKEDEFAAPGYYKVAFSNFDVSSELTSTPRVGWHRYTYDSGQDKQLMIDLGHVLQSNWGHKSTGGFIEVINNREIKGSKLSSGWADDHQVFFHATFSSPFEVLAITDSGRQVDTIKNRGKYLKAFLSFPDSKDSTVTIKVGISPVSQEGAKSNLLVEAKGWDFDQARAAAENQWRQELLKIRVKSSNKKQLTTFYTALYHMHISPMLYQDVDGKYRGIDKAIHQAESGFTNYSVYSLWDTFRAWQPLMSILHPDRTEDWIKALIRKHEEGGILPKWPLAANYTGTMVGYPAAAIIADAISKGITITDDSLTLAAIVHSSLFHANEHLTEPRAKQVSPKHLDYIEKLGYVPADSVSWSVSYGLECAYYDWCIAQVAEKVGDQSTASKYLERSQLYKNYFDSVTTFMRGRIDENQWRYPFSPTESDFNGDFIEGNSWQWSWFVPHDISGLINLMGGPEAFEEKLDALFRADSKLEGEEIPEDISGLIGQYAHGNEPSHHVAHLYNYIDQPHKTQERVKEILLNLYDATPDGIPGNEDCGQMSAWYVMNAMGFYQVCPGDPTYSIGRPLFDEVIMDIGNGKTFTVQSNGASAGKKYITAMSVNGEVLDQTFFTHEDMMQGGTLNIVMSEKR
ncbi:MAG: GH92 family glycosyl hydrolase [Cyclobacteriaceae bacterium]|nr:GH92 family glycosyl hydrolase [Cyclobacteriaceae bacterium HetDA_MAG_MS6]